MRIVIVTDAWAPQVNGVVRTLGALVGELQRTGHEVATITPQDFKTMPCPTYPEIRLSLFPRRKLARLIEAARPCAIHIATEGPLGWAARAYCLRKGLPFTTAYHTRFPEYVRARFGIPLAVSYALIRRFHASAATVMVATETVEREIHTWGITRTSRWTRGVDTDLFRPHPQQVYDLPRPIFLYVGRLAVEKNIEAFLSLDLPGSKVVVGDGPQRQDLEQKYPGVLFTGAKQGADLAAHYAGADVFVFPSRTDTFGLVLLEALACGLPVAAYPVPGPLDVIGNAEVGCLDEDLRQAAMKALGISREACRSYADNFSWSASAAQFLGNLSPFSAEASFAPAA
ncbi:glycosyltransferase family 1 protein [Telmatospirillum sp. J64-1]|uniref:glycosyltransferase family 4 protein n=1 Tax=Telmatospirillum sp. J64-1 TaxID=2502183 RepID=UPI00115F6273|nr:glycosyltransferase family 1 protein [Telmatospirillum sp. J64-1]